ncbi:MAG: hypothetical protein J6D16_00945 [Clostridia bacterium]|nr:hypothetical protein [Clostridia bacterium]
MKIFEGNDRLAYRDPTCYYHGGFFHLFFTVSEKEGGYMYNRIGYARSADLKTWSSIRLLTERDLTKNFSSPGNVLARGDGFWICFCSYPMPQPFRERHWATGDARLYTMFTRDFEHFEEPRLLNPKSHLPIEQTGRMIDPYLVEKDGQVYVFYDGGGISYATSKDGQSWAFGGRVPGGERCENPCILPWQDRYLLLASPDSGITFFESKDLLHWTQTRREPLRRPEWDWADGRLTAAFALELPDGLEHRYAVFFHGSRDVFPETHGNATLALVFTDDFETYWDEI